MHQKPVFVTFFLDASRPSSDGTCLIKMTVYQNSRKKRYGTEFHLRKEDWQKLNAPKLKDEKLKDVQKKLNALKTEAEKLIETIVPFSFYSFEESFFNKVPINSDRTAYSETEKKRELSTWFRATISTLAANEQIGTADIYRSTFNSINSFKKDLLLDDITFSFLQSYEEHLKTENKSLATIGIYMRHLRAIIKNAIKDKLVAEEDYPFRNYQIPTGQNVKKALKSLDVEKLLSYQPERPDHQKAIDFWIFSYLCNGMNFADIISLKPHSISGRFLFFYRQKTIRTKKRDLRPIKVGLSQRALSIIEKWRSREPGNPYLFPILEAGLSARKIKSRCCDFIGWVNGRMYEIGEKLEIDVKTNTYAARHTFSTVLKRKGVPISYIKDALGHSSVVTTESYLDSFEDETTLLYAEALVSFDKT